MFVCALAIVWLSRYDQITTQFRLDAQRLEVLLRSFELLSDTDAMLRDIHDTINKYAAV